MVVNMQEQAKIVMRVRREERDRAARQVRKLWEDFHRRQATVDHRIMCSNDDEHDEARSQVWNDAVSAVGLLLKKLEGR